MTGAGPSNPEMVALFRKELETHVSTLDNALSRMEGNSTFKESAGPCITAAHEISGAARLLRLDQVSEIAQSLEKLLLYHQSQRETVSTPVIQGIKAATDAFRDLLHLQNGQLVQVDQWSKELLEKLLHAQYTLKGTQQIQPKQSENEAASTDQVVTADSWQLMRKNIANLSRFLVGTEKMPQNAGDEILSYCQQVKLAAEALPFPLLRELIRELSKGLETSFKQSNAAPPWDTIINAVEWVRRFFNLAVEEMAEWVAENQQELKQALQYLQLDALDEATTQKKDSNKIEETEPTEILSSDEDDQPIDEHILGLFFVELETQAATLNDGLLSLESNPHDEEAMITLLRSAHSIKGAARVLGLAALIELSHAVEDALSAVKKSGEGLSGRWIDTMFSALDLITNLSKIAPQELQQWLLIHAKELNNSTKKLHQLVEEAQGNKQEDNSSKETVESSSSQTAISSPIDEDKAPTPAVVQASELPSLSKQGHGGQRRLDEAEQAKRTAKRDRVLRVTAEYLTRLMGLAGEILVESKWLHPFSDSLMQLKKNQYELSGIVDILRANLDETVLGDEGEQTLLDLQNKTHQCRQKLAEHLEDLELFIRRHTSLSDRLYREVITSRMCPFAEGVDAFPRMVRDLAKQLGKKIQLKVIGRSTTIDRDILDKLKAPLTHLLRNALDHGIETPEERVAQNKPELGTITVEARHRAGVLSITVIDDGRGIDLNQLRERVIEKKLVDQSMAQNLTEAELMDFLFLPGFSTSKKVTEVSGRGVGLNVVQNMVHEVSGRIRVSSNYGKGMRFSLQLPLTLSVLRALQVEISGEPYAFPLARIERAIVIDRDRIQLIENRQYYEFEENNIGLIQGHQILELAEPEHTYEELSVVVLSDSFNEYGVVVDRLIGEVELVLQELEPSLGKVSDISCGAFLEDGSPVLVIDVEDMVRSIDKLLSGGYMGQLSEYSEDEVKERKKRILVVDDSITVREVECRLLENQGYEVDVAVNGVDGWNTVRIGEYDLVVTDVDMPRMNGIDLVRHIKQDARLRTLPVMIVSYKERSEDRIQGMEAGANYYLAKSSFHDDRFLEAVKDLIGEATLTTQVENNW